MIDQWWVLSGDELMRIMRRTHAGEDPELVMLEEYANAETIIDDDDEEE